MNSMRTKLFSIAAAAAVVAVFAVQVSAHHSFAAEFDAKRPVKVRGTVVKMEWINPHSWIHIDVKDPATGKVERWMVEGGAPNALLRRGWTKNSLPEGTEILVEGFPAKDPGHRPARRRAGEVVCGRCPGPRVSRPYLLAASTKPSKIGLNSPVR